MDSEILVGNDFKLLSKLLLTVASGPLETNNSYYKILLVREKVLLNHEHKKQETKPSLLLFTPASLGIKLLDINANEGYWCLISERWFIQFTLLKQITVNPLFSRDTDQIAIEKTDRTFERLFKIMLRESLSGNSHKYDSIFNCIALLLLEAIKKQQTRTPDNEFNDAVELFEALQYLLKENFKKIDRIARPDMFEPGCYAEILSVELDFLNNVVSLLSGKNIREQITDQFFYKANQLLQNSDRNLSDIASQMGFNSPVQFQKFYKKNSGITPIAYRKGTKFILPNELKK